MADLANEISDLRDNSLSILNELHDDYIHTKKLWRTVQIRVARYGESFSFHNQVTGRRYDAIALAARAGGSIRRLNERTFKDIVGQFELFFVELLKLWLVSHPDLLEEKALDVGTLLKAVSLSDAQTSAIEEAAASTVLKKAYAKPADWMRYINRIFKTTVISDSDSRMFSEIKATRDLLEHARGIVNTTYLEKASVLARGVLGDPIEIDTSYHKSAFQFVRDKISDLATAAVDAI